MHHHVQPREGEPLCNEQASEEIQKFSSSPRLPIPTVFAKEPSVSSADTLSSLFKAPRKIQM